MANKDWKNEEREESWENEKERISEARLVFG